MELAVLCMVIVQRCTIVLVWLGRRVFPSNEGHFPLLVSMRRSLVFKNMDRNALERARLARCHNIGS